MSKSQKMNAGKVNLLFLVIVITHISLVGLLYFFPNLLEVVGILNILTGQLLILIPTIIFVIFEKINVKDVLCFRLVRPTTILLVFLFTYLMIPLTSLLNAISLTFAPNIVMDLTNEMLDYPMLVTWILIGLIGPICEELVCRGVIYEGYKKSVSPTKAMIFSALIFGLLHMNFNQMPYAFAIGIFLVLLKEATGSILAPILFHVLFNTNSVILMYLVPADLAEQSVDLIQVSGNELSLMIAVLAIIALFTTAIGLCLLPYIARREKRNEQFSSMWIEGRKNKDRIRSIPLFIGIIVCFLFMGLQIFLK